MPANTVKPLDLWDNSPLGKDESDSLRSPTKEQWHNSPFADSSSENDTTFDNYASRIATVGGVNIAKMGPKNPLREGPSPQDQASWSTDVPRPAKVKGVVKRKAPTGCKTCHRRHIRCGAEWPECRNCVKHNCRCDSLDTTHSPAMATAELRVTVEKGDISTTEFLLRTGADVEHTDAFGFTPLLIAAKNGHTELCRMLLSNSAVMVNSQARDTFGRNALHFALKYNAGEEIIPLLLKHGVDPNARDLEGRTPLHYSVEHNKERAALDLLSINADIESTDRALEETPLSLAFRKEKVKLVKVLLRAGASIKDRSLSRSSPDIQDLVAEHLAAIKQHPTSVSSTTARDQKTNKQSLYHSWPTKLLPSDPLRKGQSKADEHGQAGIPDIEHEQVQQLVTKSIDGGQAEVTSGRQRNAMPSNSRNIDEHLLQEMTNVRDTMAVMHSKHITPKNGKNWTTASLWEVPPTSEQDNLSHLAAKPIFGLKQIDSCNPKPSFPIEGHKLMAQDSLANYKLRSSLKSKLSSIGGQRKLPDKLAPKHVISFDVHWFAIGNRMGPAFNISNATFFVSIVQDASISIDSRTPFRKSRNVRSQRSATRCSCITLLGTFLYWNGQGLSAFSVPQHDLHQLLESVSGVLNPLSRSTKPDTNSRETQAIMDVQEIAFSGQRRLKPVSVNSSVIIRQCIRCLSRALDYLQDPDIREIRLAFVGWPFAELVTYLMLKNDIDEDLYWKAPSEYIRKDIFLVYEAIRGYLQHTFSEEKWDEPLSRPAFVEWPFAELFSDYEAIGSHLQHTFSEDELGGPFSRHAFVGWRFAELFLKPLLDKDIDENSYWERPFEVAWKNVFSKYETFRRYLQHRLSKEKLDGPFSRRSVTHQTSETNDKQISASEGQGTLVATARMTKANSPSCIGNSISKESEGLMKSKEEPNEQKTGILRSTSLAFSSSLLSTLKLAAEFFELREKPLESRNQRIRWTCVCGARMYDDFREVTTGSLEQLQGSLNETYSNKSTNPNAIPQQQHESTTRLNQSPQTLPVSPAKASSNESAPTGGLRQRGEGHTHAPDGTNADSTWILPIFQHERYGTKVKHLPVKLDMSDETLFTTIKARYLEESSRMRRFFALRGVKKISCVKFIHAPREPDIHKFDDWPTQKHSPPWIYKGCPAKKKHIPLVGHTYLMHLWQNPTHTDMQTYRSRDPGLLPKLFRCLRLAFPSEQASTPGSQAAAAQTQQDIELACTSGSNTVSTHASTSSGSQLPLPTQPQLHTPSKPQDFRSSYVFLRTPKKVGEQLLPDDENPPEGWGLYFEEGFRIHHFFVILLLFYVLASLAFGLYWCIKYGAVGPHSGVEAFAVSSWMIALMSLVTTVWLKWAD